MSRPPLNAERAVKTLEAAIDLLGDLADVLDESEGDYDLGRYYHVVDQLEALRADLDRLALHGEARP